MIQTIRLYQAVLYNKRLSSKPVLATEKTWLGSGFYFWEHEIDNAHHWGEKHCNNQYCIYESSYQNTEAGLDLVDNYEHRDLLIRYIKELEELTGDNNITLARIIALICKKVPHKIHYIRIDTGSFFWDDKTILPVPNKRPLPWIFTKRLVQVCFPSFPCKEIGLIDYRLCEYRLCEYRLTFPNSPTRLDR